jgi:hypothetical protein
VFSARYLIFLLVERQRPTFAGDPNTSEPGGITVPPVTSARHR